MKLEGIDVSEWQGNIDWKTVADHIDFAVIRAGYGVGHRDKKYARNVTEAVRQNVPIALYWFSYAATVEDARREAQYACEAAASYGLNVPIFYDFEYDSSDFVQHKTGKRPTNKEIDEFANTFCAEVKRRGFPTGVYTNLDYARMMGTAVINWPVWLAQWGVSKPSMPCTIWQYSSTKEVPGIRGPVDHDTADSEKLIERGFKALVKQVETRYQTLSDLPEWAVKDIRWLLEKKTLVGDEHGNLDLSKDMLRVLCVVSRAMQRVGCQK